MDLIELTSDNYQEEIKALSQGIILVKKELCPHCKNMLKVLERFSAQKPDVKYATVDSEKETQVMEYLQAERVPTLIVVKEGELCQKKGGLMNPRELKAFYEK